MCNKILYKDNIYCELLLVKRALSPFQHIIRQNQANHQNNITLPSSKAFYYQFKKANQEIPCNAFLPQYEPNTHNFDNVYRIKIMAEKEIKLKEFNYKLLHGILPCNKNLERWKIRSNNICDVCNQIQTIEHLLFQCRYVKPIWNIVDKVFDSNVTFMQILGLDSGFQYNRIVTLTSFLIYKQWLQYSFENKARNNVMSMLYLKNELSLRYEIYKLCKSIPSAHIDNIQSLIDNLK